MYTLGHSTRSIDELIEILRARKITRLVDIRSIPRSRTNPQFNCDVLPTALSAAGITYSRIDALGGRRTKSRSVPPDVDAGWNVQSFHNYADYAQTESFRIGLAQLLDFARRETCAIMCAEALWWRCHRRIVADHALAHGVPVVHLYSREKSERASLTAFAIVGEDARVSYPAR